MVVPRLGALRRMTAALAGLPFILLNPSCLIGTDAQLIDCYKFDGTIAPNNTRCPNSNTCCGAGSACLSTRLCMWDGNLNSKADLVRGPCAVKTWDDSCPQICTYNETRYYPKVSACGDGSLCCDDDPDCCEKGLGIFLDESGNRVSTRGTAYTTTYPPTAGGASRYTLVPSLDAGSSASTSKAAASTTKTPSTTETNTTDGEASSTGTASNADDPSEASESGNASDATSSTQPSSASSSNSDDSLGLKIGLGFGIPAAIFATAAFMYFRLRPRGPRDAGYAAGYAAGSAAGGAMAERTSVVEPYQLAGSVPGYPGPEYGGGPPMPPPRYQNPYPVELGGGHNISEMPVPNSTVQQHFPVPSTPKL